MLSQKGDFAIEKPFKLVFPTKTLEKEKPKQELVPFDDYEDLDEKDFLNLIEEMTIFKNEESEELGNLLYEISYYQGREKEISNPFMNKNGPVLKEHDENYENLLSRKECTCLLLHCETKINLEKIKKSILLTPFDFLCQEHKIIVNETYMKKKI